MFNFQVIHTPKGSTLAILQADGFFYKTRFQCGSYRTYQFDNLTPEQSAELKRVMELMGHKIT